MARRKGEWSYSLPFALNNSYYGDFVQSVQFNTIPINVDPIISQFDIDGTDPSGSRHLTNHASFIKLLASGQGLAQLTFDPMDLNATNISTGSGISNTKCFIFRIRKFDTPNTIVRNMTVWASDLSDFLTPETNKLVWETHSTWQLGLALPISYMGDPTKWMPITLPANQNLLRQDDKVTIHGSGDADVSQYVYVALAASGTMPLGEYGSTNEPSGFKIRVTYSYDNIFSLLD